jgi:hypothetical protein
MPALSSLTMVVSGKSELREPVARIIAKKL